MLFSLVKNELIKIFKKTKTWVVFLLFVAAIVLVAVSLFKVEESEKKYSSPEYRLTVCNESIERNNRQIQDLKQSNDEGDKEYVNELTEQIKMLEKEKAMYEDQIKSGTDKDAWKKSLDNRIEQIKADIENCNDKDVKVSLEQELGMLNYMKQNNINNTESWKVNPYKVIEAIFMLLGAGILIVGIALFMSDIVSGECTPPTLKVLLIQPVSRAKVLLSKFIAVTTTVLTMIIGTEIIAFIVIGFIRGFNHSIDPIILGKKYEIYKDIDIGQGIRQVAGSGYMATNSEYIFKSFLFQALFIITCCAFIFMISSLFKSSMITMAVSVALVLGVSILSQSVNIIRKISHLIFFNYGVSTSVITGNITDMYRNVNMNLTNGIIVMIVTTIVSYIIANVVFSKKDILI